MIKYNNYPPKEIGDVELTREGRELIRNRRHVTLKDEAQYDRSTVRLYAYGESIGSSILSAVESNDRELARELAEPIIDEVFSLRPDEADALLNGLASQLNVRDHAEV